jgi:hypothetical protein
VHFFLVVEEEPVVCSYCDKSLKNQKALLAHQKRVHKVFANDSKVQPPRNKSLLFCGPSAKAFRSGKVISQGCQIFLGPNIPNWENNTNEQKLGIPNGHKLYQMAMKYSKWS